MPGKQLKSIYLQIGSNNTFERHFFNQDPQIDRGRITAIEVPSQTDLVYIAPQGRTPIENLTAAELATFVFTLAIEDEVQFEVPLIELNRTTNGSKYFFVDSPAGKHRIGDSFVTQIAAGSFSGRYIKFNIWYE